MHHEALTEEGLRLYPAVASFDDFYLAGGTALALQIGHRVSVDFDLFTSGAVPRNMLAKAERAFGEAGLSPIVSSRDELTVIARGVKVTFLSYPFPPIEPLASDGGLRMLSVREIAATKAYSIGRRGTYKDYVDLHFVIAGGYATMAEIVAMAERKFGGAFNSRLLAEQLLFMDDIEDFKISYLATPVTPAEIRRSLARAAAEIADPTRPAV